MGLMAWLGFPRADRRRAEIAEILARQCRESVWALVQTRAGSMSPDEARGYLRVRSAMLVERHVDRMRSISPQAAKFPRAQLVQGTLMAVTGQLIDRMVRVEAAARPARRVA